LSSPYETTGVVERILGNNNYLVQIQVEDQTRSVLCHLSGKMRQFKISVIVGDQVRVEIPPPYDKGRITFREKT
jgi:translation initiation factor IF-1